MRSYLRDWNSTSGGAGSAVPGEVLSKMGLTLGSNARIFAGLYIETSLLREQVRWAGGRAGGRVLTGRKSGWRAHSLQQVDGATPDPPNQTMHLFESSPLPPRQLYALWPKGTCEELGLAGKINVTLREMVSAMVEASNPPAAALALNAQLDGMMGPALAGGPAAADNPFGLIGELAMNCTDVVPAFVKTAEDLNRKLYCGYYQSRCGSGTGPQQLSAAYDWKGTNDIRWAGAAGCFWVPVSHVERHVCMQLQVCMHSPRVKLTRNVHLPPTHTPKTPLPGLSPTYTTMTRTACPWGRSPRSTSASPRSSTSRSTAGYGRTWVSWRGGEWGEGRVLLAGPLLAVWLAVR